MLVMRLVVVKAGRHDIARIQVCLHLRDISHTPEDIVISAVGQFSNYDVVVLAVDAVEIPQLALLDRSGQGQARIEFVQRNSLFVLQ